MMITHEQAKKRSQPVNKIKRTVGIITEKHLQTYLFSRADDHGVFCRKVRADGHTGFPDAFLVFAGHIALVEIKSPTGKGRLSKKQEREIARLRDQGVNVHIVDSYEGVDNVIKQISDG